MEPTLSQIDDFRNEESPRKKRLVYMIVAALVVLGMIYSTAKAYYDHHTPESFNPVVQK